MAQGRGISANIQQSFSENIHSLLPSPWLREEVWGGKVEGVA